MCSLKLSILIKFPLNCDKYTDNAYTEPLVGHLKSAVWGKTLEVNL